MTEILSSFESENENKWYTINDDVMGGISDSQFYVNDEKIGIFKGEVSLENNGGFASCRMDLNSQSLFKSFKLKVKGDQKTYKFRVISQEGITFQKTFDTTSDWSEIELQFQDFQAVFRGRLLNYKTPKYLNPRSIGILISDKQEGNFELKIDWIKGALFN
ncbi:CIA30 family protein [Sediminitomix flava]|uniref:Complex I intermediate-associated protein 30 (CIA30) n=1 Tax=Sediminitomix flava TaxID=379075 RepID=A0A315Z6X7_SEDFL|nr:CIA30 family protein [Sediminitomix flava]PWJ40188.1 complex I intermediate-associated protein 30 (CIA30) [Sediminitomix flava]